MLVTFSGRDGGAGTSKIAVVVAAVIKTTYTTVTTVSTIIGLVAIWGTITDLRNDDHQKDDKNVLEITIDII